MHHQLTIVAGPQDIKGTSFELTEGQILLIGRGDASDTKLNDAHMSRVHCEVAVQGSKVVVRDKGSSGGTYINDRKISEQVLRSGDTFSVGSSRFEYRVRSDEDETTVLGGIPGRPAPPREAKPVAQLVGETLAHFRLDRIIAKGQSGLMFEADDTKKNRRAAVKVLDPTFSDDEEQKQRFVRAMKTVMPLRHENIVEIYGAGKQGPYCWVAMEFIDGKSMSKWIEEIGTAGMLEWHDAFHVGVHIARALEFAHEQNIVHRNVTPQNILQRKEDKVTKLGDLMLAKALEGTASQQLTQADTILGEVAYLAPERTVDQTKADIRSDIYGLGATLYALLTGRPPFENDFLPDLMRSIRQDEPDPPKKYNIAIPDLFQDVIMKMLAKRREDRYRTPSELLKDLTRVGKFQGMEF